MKLSIKEQLARIREHTVEIIPEEELAAKLASGRPLRVKLGVDPTGPDIHLGHAVVLRKLRLFQDLGHVAVLIVGDFTGMIGDPSGRSEGRPQLTREQVEKNVANYRSQVEKILDPAKTEIRYNGEWCNKLTPEQILRLAATHTVAQMLARDDFEQRYKSEQPIGIHELLYPIFQGYDSVAIRSDIELGGTEQKFNLLVGRELQRDEFWRIRDFIEGPSKQTWHQLLHAGNAARVVSSCRAASPSAIDWLRRVAERHAWGPTFGLPGRLLDQLSRVLPESPQAFQIHPSLLDQPLGQVIITFPILVGTDGVRRMGKSLGNYIGVTEPADDMYGKVMSLADQVMGDFFSLCTDVPAAEIEQMLAEMKSGALNPRDAKRRLAKEIVTLYHSVEAAEAADATFLRVFSHARSQTLEDYAALAEEVAIPEDLRDGPVWISTAIHRLGLAKTKSEATRLVKSGAVHVSDRQISDPQEGIRLEPGAILRVGKRRVARLIH